MKTTNLYRAGITALALLLAACNNPAGPGSGTLTGETIPDGMGLARIQLNTGETAQSVRTALPGGVGAYYYTLKFTTPGKTTVERQLGGGIMTAAVPLEPVVWTLQVNGYTTSARTTLAVTGRTTLPITAGTETSFTVYLTPDFGADQWGDLSYNISFPPAPASIRAWLGLYPIDDTPGTSLEIDISSSTGNSSWTDPLRRGSYRAVISLYDSANNEAAAWTGVVHIHRGLTTPLNHTFTAADFAPCPPLAGVSANTLAAKLTTALYSPSGAYTISLDGTETDLSSFTPQTLNVTGSRNISITLRGNGKLVKLGGTGSLFTLNPASGSLSLELYDVTLGGRSDNTASLVRVNSRGTLIMKAGSYITGNTITPAGTNGGGVYVTANGTFTMSGGSVRNNATSSSGGGAGGGVYVTANGTFTMSGGDVSYNTTPGYEISYTEYNSGRGGGMCVDGGTFTMSGGAVYNNTASWGGGVGVEDGTFTMNGGAVYNNTVSGHSSVDGGGVHIINGTLNMSGGTVSDNEASAAFTSSGGSSGSRGGGVYIVWGTLNMSGGTVSGNMAYSASSFISESYGGGVYLVDSTFTMSGGEVSYNTARSTPSGSSVSYSEGGGVHLTVGTFTMSGGAVSHNEAVSNSTSISTSSSYGGGVYIATAAGGESGTFIMSGGEVDGNAASGAGSSYTSGGGVWVSYNGAFIKHPGAVIYGSNESDSALQNTAGANADAVYISGSAARDTKIRNTTAGRYLTLDSSRNGSAGGWEIPPPTSGISGITYNNTWPLQSDGRRMSPAIGHNSVTKSRVNFTTTSANANITIQLDVSSDLTGDFTFISALDNGSATYQSGHYPGSRISGTASVTIAIPVPTAGSHFIDICYQKNGVFIGGSDCAWFKVIE